ncbi:hypothetical protein C0J52_26930 [Blattella germanica]|nr:hypothetical protein C0J52_26930 [Blattella germanica]
MVHKDVNYSMTFLKNCLFKNCIYMVPQRGHILCLPLKESGQRSEKKIAYSISIINIEK